MEQNIDNLMLFGVDRLERNEIKQLLLNNSNNVDDAYMSYFDALNNGSLSSFKDNLRRSQAKWDETAFGGAAYGADDSNIPSTSVPAQGASKSYTADWCWCQLSILTMLQVLRTIPTAPSIAPHPRARRHERATPPRKPRPATRPCKVYLIPP
jgi:hypothetical protein